MWTHLHAHREGHWVELNWASKTGSSASTCPHLNLCIFVAPPLNCLLAFQVLNDVCHGFTVEPGELSSTIYHALTKLYIPPRTR